MSKKYFTVEEANRLLPEIIPILRRLMRLHRSISTIAPREVKRLARSRAQNGGSAQGNRYLHDYRQFRSWLLRLQEMGVLLKDVEQGLIDFPHLREGREVYLCWQLGEKGITYWHEIHAGYAGRQPL
ncbi:MAG: DUF2203 family protein [Nitrospinota bacterium]|nr:MAG: DUF2203 family protein [Nitrospinota bacterium]